MDNPHAQRSKGWSGLAFVALIIVSVMVSGTAPPGAGADAATVNAYLTGHQRGLLIAGWLIFPALAFFLWFVVGMSRYLRRMAADDEGLPAYVLVSGLATALVALIGSMLTTALALATGSLGPAALRLVWSLSALANGAYLAMAAAVFAFGIAHSMRRHQSGPVWLVWLGYTTAAGQAVTSFGLFYSSGMTFDSPGIALVLGFVLFAAWIVCVSANLIVQGSRQLESSAA